MDLFSIVSHFSFMSENASPTSTEPDDSSEEEALTLNSANLLEPEEFLKEAEAEEDKEAERGEIYGKAGRRLNEVAKSRGTDEACAIEETPATP